MLEAAKHAASSFATLTYADENLPEGGSLVPRDMQLWLKRLRKEVGPLRYFLVGEYGDQTWRPHYHAALFGVGPEMALEVQNTWGLGHTMLGTLNEQSAAYVAGYVTKKMTSEEDKRLCGRHPEFARMSLRPGIGADAMGDVAHVLFSAAGAAHVARSGDVPAILRSGGKARPLGRYLRRKLREEMGFATTGGQEKPARDQAAEVRALSEAAGGAAAYRSAKDSEMNQRVLQAEGKARIWSKKGKL